MKKILIPIGALLLSNLAHAQLSTTENYVYSKTYLSDPTLPNVKTSENVQYFDGLGRPKQVVNIKASPQGKDVVTHIEYDGFGRQVKDYLPVPQSQTLNGAIVPNPLANAVNTPYGSEKIYAEKQLENSPLDRVLGQKQVGNAWDNKPVQFGYDANIDGEVKKYVATFNYTTFTSSLALSGSYGTAQLYKNTVTDEDGNKTIEFKNGQGQVLLVRKVGDTGNVDTYYVYNDYNQLAYVIPPLASVTGAVDETTLDNLCYRYKYDGRNRLVEKKLPGKGWEYMVYDKSDRLILTQDANMRPQNKWLLTKYDQFGRVAYTGIIDGSIRNRANWADILKDLLIVESRNDSGFSKSGMTVYYTNNYFIPDTTDLLSVNYYDSYPQGTPNISSPILNQEVIPQAGQGVSVSTKGFPTASYVKNIEDDNWTKNYTWYDKKGRPISKHSVNHLGGYTKSESELDFAGVVKRSNIYHLRKQGEIGVTVNERFMYDNQNRLTQHYHQVDSKPEVLLSENSYNELSQLKNKTVGNNLQSIDYAYNIRGWMTDVNKDQMAIPDLGGKLFSYKIKYNEKQGITNPDPSQFAGKDVVAKFNGNIAEVDWRTVETSGVNPSLNPKRYGYSYDKLNRLTAGYYQNPNNPYSKENTESLSYDSNGNISNLYRTSVMEYGSNTATVIDNLEYTYIGNQAFRIKDNSGNSTGYEGTAGFPMNYDANGNMKNMVDKDITGIDYNYLNLPSNVNIGFSQVTTQIKTKYRADGIKVRKENVNSSIGFAGTDTTTQITDYLDGFQYFKSVFSSTGIGGGSGSLDMMMAKRAFEPQAFTPIDFTSPAVLTLKTPDLQFFPTEEGFYDYQKDQYIYQYKDHLGNVRVSYGRNNSGVLEIVDNNDFYPFGMNHLKTGNAYYGSGSYENYKYNGKELQETGMYDYGARMYMPDLGRWGVVDPLAEKMTRFSPYNYAFNNPISFIDPDGRETKGWINQMFENGTQKVTYNASVNTVQEAMEAGYTNVYGVADAGEITNKADGSVAYSLNSDGSVTDAAGETSNGYLTTSGGISIQAKDAFDLSKYLSHLGNAPQTFYTNLGGAAPLNYENPFFRGDIDKIVSVDGYFGGIYNGLSRGDKSDPNLKSTLMNTMVDLMSLVDISVTALSGNKAPDSIDVTKSIWNQNANKLIDTVHTIPNTNEGIGKYYDRTSPRLDSISSSRLHNWAVKNYGKK